MKQIACFIGLFISISALAQSTDQDSVRVAWVGSIVSKLKQAMPHGIDHLYSAEESKSGCKANITILPTGDVLDVTFPTPCSDGLEKALEWVIYGAQPLPLPSDMSAFERSINIRFRPDAGH